MSAAELRVATGERELRAAMALREEVFVGEQGVPLSLEVDDHDPIATHLIVVEDDVVVATTRLLEDGDVVRLGRLAVARHARGRGLARSLLAEAERRARQDGRSRILLSAQTYACELYRAAGYVERGAPYMEAGIEHVTMELSIDA